MLKFIDQKRKGIGIHGPGISEKEVLTFREDIIRAFTCHCEGTYIRDKETTYMNSIVVSFTESYKLYRLRFGM